MGKWIIYFYRSKILSISPFISSPLRENHTTANSAQFKSWELWVMSLPMTMNEGKNEWIILNDDRNACYSFRMLSISCLESENLSYVCTPWQNSAYPLAESFAIGGFCQGYTHWLHACCVHQQKALLAHQPRAIAIFHLTLGMKDYGWWVMDDR